MQTSSRRFSPKSLLLSSAFVGLAALGAFAFLSANGAQAHPHADAANGGVLSSNSSSDHLHLGLEAGNKLVAYRYAVAIPRGAYSTDPLTGCRVKFVGLSVGEPEIRVATHEGVELHGAAVGFAKAAYEFEGERFEVRLESFDAKAQTIVAAFERAASEAAAE